MRTCWCSGADDGSVSVYEDDPSTTKYATSDQFAHTTCAYTRSSDSTMAMEVKISTVVNAGSTKAYLPASRPYVIRLHNAIVPSDVVVNGESIRMGKFRKLGDTPAIVTGASSFYFDSDDMVVVIELAAADVNKPQSVEITWTYPHAVSTGLTNGVKGVLGHALLAKSQLDTTRSTPGQQTSVPGPAHLTYLASMGSLLDMHASYANISGFVDVLSSLPALFNLALDETAANIYDANACVQMVNWDRFDSCLCCTQVCMCVCVVTCALCVCMCVMHVYVYVSSCATSHRIASTPTRCTTLPVSRGTSRSRVATPTRSSSTPTTRPRTSTTG